MSNVTNSARIHKATGLHAVGGTNAAPGLQLARDYLRARGATLEDFEAASGEVVANANRIDPMYPNGPALVFWFRNPLTGKPLTYTDAGGRTVPFHRIKPLGAPGAKFLQPRQSGTHVFFAAHSNMDWPTVLSDPSYGLIISEGETRSLAGAVCDPPIAVVSITGVDCGQVDGKLHPDFAYAEWRGRLVYLAFDSDVARKPGPKAALAKLTALLQQRGADVYEVAIPPAADGSKQGLDDLLARHGADALAKLLESPETQPAAGAELHEPPVILADLLAADYPPTEWVWDNFVLKGDVNLLFGDGGVGKSLLALHLAIAVAAGKPLLGGATVQMSIIGLFAEDGAAQVQQRARSILPELGLGLRLAPDGNLPIKLWCQPRSETALARVADDGTVTELPRLHALRAELVETGEPALVILDSMADLFALNESLRLPVNAAMKQVLGGLCRDFGATVLVLAHPSKASMQDGTHYSGSTAYNNAVRQRLTLEIAKRDAGDFTDGPPPRLLKVAKSNYGAMAEKTLWFYGATIMELPRALANDTRASLFHKVCIDAAIEAACNNVPCNRVHINEAVFEQAAKVLGRRPSRKEVLGELEKGASAKELIFDQGSSKRAAGFYMPNPEAAAAIALAVRKTKKSGRRESADG
jgi:AAA domain/Domain of unknown function (DUF3854)